MDTGNPTDRVYTHDLFTLEQSPRLGAGLMEMENTTFPWTLNYDEMDYVIEGELSILMRRGEGHRRAGGGSLYPQGVVHPVFRLRTGAVFVLCLPANWQEQK